MEAGSRDGALDRPERVLHLGSLTPPPSDYSVATWDRGVFQRASRPWTDLVEGRITPSSPLLMVTLRGGARRHEFSTDDGLRVDGPDRAGMVSFLPAGCERRLRLRGVEWSWASITLDDVENVPAFGGVHDPVIKGALAEMARVHVVDGNLEPSYCEAFAGMLSAYLGRRFGLAEREAPARRVCLTDRQLRHLGEYVEAHLDEPIRVATLARLLCLSEGHLHRALRMTTGDTPLSFINRHRVERAAELFRSSAVGIQEAALTVGFTSPSAFARVFRGIVGCSPSEYRRTVQR